MKKITFYTVDDQIPEDDETLVVYIVPRTDGVRVAQPSTDNGRKVCRFVLNYWLNSPEILYKPKESKVQTRLYILVVSLLVY